MQLAGGKPVGEDSACIQNIYKYQLTCTSTGFIARIPKRLGAPTRDAGLKNAGLWGSEKTGLYSSTASLQGCRIQSTF